VPHQLDHRTTISIGPIIGSSIAQRARSGYTGPIMVATRFAVAVHILLLLAVLPAAEATSARLAESVNTNPVVVRRITRQLARAGLVCSRRGARGASLARPAGAITLADVWRAVATEGPLIGLHAHPNEQCRIGCRVNAVLAPAFGEAETALVARLSGTTLAGLLAKVCPEAA
jgi:DNA-binding IscR family transcriptional regulator